MYDFKEIVENREFLENNLRIRDSSISFDELIELINLRSEKLKNYESLRAEVNLNNKKAGIVYDDQRNHLKKLGNLSKSIKDDLKNIESKLYEKIIALPNIVGPKTPISANKEDSIIEKVCGQKPVFSFTPKNHYDLCKSLDILDMERGVKLAESGFPIYKGKGAVLEWALLTFMINHSVNNGFTFYLPPFFNNTKSLVSSGNLPKFAEEIYSCVNDDLHAIPTAEVPLTNLFRDEVLSEKNLPMHMIAYSPCFRREAGGYGKKTRGLLRLHQFNKVESYSICKPEDSSHELELLVDNATKIMEKLNLHFRVANLPSCDIAQQSSQTYDIEAWLPADGIYSEVSSASNCLSYQAKRANIKFKTPSGTNFVHTLNASALATPRLFIALVESNQTHDGNIVIPSALRQYTGFDIITPE
ncbi:MAG: serine--tRNA ligase [Candidatus Woesearchaeota archaeon]|jgi:seryl-tRNA synthetase